MKSIFKILTILTNLTKEKKKEAKKKRKITIATVTFYFESTGESDQELTYLHCHSELVIFN